MYFLEIVILAFWILSRPKHIKCHQSPFAIKLISIFLTVSQRHGIWYGVIRSRSKINVNNFSCVYFPFWRSFTIAFLPLQKNLTYRQNYKVNFTCSPTTQSKNCHKRNRCGLAFVCIPSYVATRVIHWKTSRSITWWIHFVCIIFYWSIFITFSHPHSLSTHNIPKR